MIVLLLIVTTCLVVIGADVEVGSWVLLGHWLAPLPFAYVLFNIAILLGVLYAFTREQPDDEGPPIKERGIK